MEIKKDFENKIAIVTGGGTGIGKETARELLAGGAKVVINGRREKILRDAAHELDPGGKRIAWVAGDAGQKPVAERLTAVAVERFGGVDILINNAGIFRPTPFLEHSEADVDAYLSVAVKGPFFASQAAIPEMLKRGGGSIVNVGSIWALIAVGATPSSAYSAGKAGMHTLTRNQSPGISPCSNERLHDCGLRRCRGVDGGEADPPRDTHLRRHRSARLFRPRSSRGTGL